MDDAEKHRLWLDAARKEDRLKAEKPKFVIDKRYGEWQMRMLKTERKLGLLERK